jgi:hypothetical protein
MPVEQFATIKQFIRHRLRNDLACDLTTEGIRIPGRNIDQQYFRTGATCDFQGHVEDRATNVRSVYCRQYFHL